MQSDTRTLTPCVGVCSTVYGDRVCRGCKRFAAEIVRWNGYSEDQRVAIIERLDGMLAEVLSPRLEVLDADLLQRAVRRHGVRVQAERGSWHLAGELLRTRADRIDPAACGLRIRSPHDSLSLGSLRDEIEEDLMMHAEAWLARCYGRYVGSLTDG